MKRNGKKILMSVTALLAVFSLGGSVLSATEESYSYITGQQKSQSRNEIYAQAEKIESEEERKAFLNSKGIAETPFSEENKAKYSYVEGQVNGKAFRKDDTSDQPENPLAQTEEFNYLIGKTRGASYRKDE